MTGSDQPSAALARATPRRWQKLLFALAVLLLTICVAIWLQRRTIAREYADRELSRRGVRAHYQITQLSPRHQRLTNVVIGDPRDPDLVADWIDIRTALSPWRAELLALSAGRVRVKGRLVDGRLSLGAIDRLLPAPSGKPFALPHVDLDVADLRLRLDSGHGSVDVALTGRGVLDNGFTGTAKVAAPRLAFAGCAASGVTATLAVQVRRLQPAVAGPIAASRLACADAAVDAPRIGLQARFGAALDRWRGTADIALNRFETAGRSLSAVRGRLSFDGTAGGATRGGLALESGGLDAPEARVTALALAGDYRKYPGGLDYRGTLVARGVSLPRRSRAQIVAAAEAAGNTPLAPLAAKLAASAGRAAAGFDATAEVAVASSAAGWRYRVPRVAIVAANGVRLRFDRGHGLSGDHSGGMPRVDGTLALHGGGMPEALLRLTQTPGDPRLHGVGFVQPYAAGGAALSLARIAFTADRDGGTLRTVATLSGPLPGGRIDGLTLPLDARWRGRRVTLNPSCATFDYRGVALSGGKLAPGRLRACPIGGAMLDVAPGRIGGGIRLDRPDFSGRVGASPLHLRAAAARIDLADRHFAVTDAQVRLGADSVTRLDAAALSGSFADRVAGAFSGLGGQIGAVPLVLSGAAGTWQVRDAALLLGGKFQLSDAAAPPRFHPLASDDAQLRLVGNRIVASAGLKTPVAGIAVARVAVRHDLGDGRGSASIEVPGLRFAEGGLQPNDLTPLTFGVIADVSGTVEGSGRIDWSSRGVTSTGRFGTKSVDLAAAFGSVRGLATDVAFTDLLNLQTASGQRATVAEINPGVPVSNGNIGFRILDAQRVAIEGARWPFAGGELVLEPTVLDFSEHRARRMTFQVIGADAALFLKQMEFDNLDATGTFDGTLPMIFDEQGGRIEGGSLRARAGGSLAYVGEISQRDVGFWGNMAFQALKALDYKSLTIAMNGPLAGDMVTEIRFAGVSQGKGTKSNFLLRRLAKLPFVFNVRVSAPFKQLLDSVQSWYDPNRLIERNLPSLLEEQEKSDKAGPTPVQPRESVTPR